MGTQNTLNQMSFLCNQIRISTLLKHHLCDYDKVSGPTEMCGLHWRHLVAKLLATSPQTRL